MIGGYAKQVTAVTPGGVADRAGIQASDVLDFVPVRTRTGCWPAIGRCPMDSGASLPVRRADGSRIQVDFTPQRVAYLPTLNDRMALLARLISLTVMAVVGVFMVWARPGLMTWSLLLAFSSGWPSGRPPGLFTFFAFEATGARPQSSLPSCRVRFIALVFAFVTFALCFPRNTLAAWAWRKRVLGLLVVLAFI